MPKFGAATEKFESKKQPVGIFEVRLDSFKPAKAKSGDSYNLQPQLIVINDAAHMDEHIFENLNTTAFWTWPEFSHAFGVMLEGEAEGASEKSLPGEFVPADEPDPAKWSYVGPLLGQTARVETAEYEDKKGVKRIGIKRYFCRVPGCTYKHRESLL
jgi:hypothetical protein